MVALAHIYIYFKHTYIQNFLEKHGFIGWFQLYLKMLVYDWLKGFCARGAQWFWLKRGYRQKVRRLGFVTVEIEGMKVFYVAKVRQ